MENTLIADSSVWIAYFNGKTCRETDRLDVALTHRIGPRLLAPIALEVLSGFRNDFEHRSARNLFHRLPTLPISDDTYFQAAHLYRHLRKKGVTPGGPMDCLIAQACVEHHTPLLTLDDDFRHIARHCSLRLL